MTNTEDTLDDASTPICESKETTTDDPCQRPVSNPGDRCYLHRDDADGPPAGHGAPEGNDNALQNDGGAPPVNGNAERHGLHADRSLYYQRLEDDEQAWVDGMVNAWLKDAPFTRENLAGLELLRKAAIDEHKRRKANDYIAAKGVITENVVGYDDEGNPIVKKSENPAHLPYSRLAGDTIRTLKELGVLESPDAQLADSVASWGEAAQKVAQRKDRDIDAPSGGDDHR
ncbi:hypothetical protein [Haloprofundus halophilus]|uniref:hypothetical protein n=1 Tax=Haloprofundus halophilus TaxID=2283527 RepID=UPI000E447C41|nr:hypothetical protein [Haloprofundus halophilus]